jgi:putative transposase
MRTPPWLGITSLREAAAERLLSPNRRFRGECFDKHTFRSLPEAKRIIEEWRRDYNAYRPT